MKIILFGAPGSGKGTQADMLAVDFGLPKVSLGDILREEAEKGSGLGLQIKECMERGDLVSDSLVAEVIKERLGSSGFILDGYPRNLGQAKTLDKILEEKNSSIDKFIYLDVSRDTIVSRLSKRRVCKECKANYHLEAMPPKVEGFCDFCGDGLTQRSDDNPEAIKKRWSLFLENSKEIFNFYKNKNKFISVFGDKPKEEVFKEIKEKINES